jgi:hypothetical protein
VASERKKERMNEQTGLMGRRRGRRRITCGVGEEEEEEHQGQARDVS